MTVSSFIRNSLLTGVCIGLLSGCSWLEDWSWPGRDDKQTASLQAVPPAATNSKVVEAAGGTWIQENAQQVTTVPAHQRPMGLSIDEDAAQRIAQLEAEVENLRNELRTMMPAVAKLAAAQGSLHDAIAHIEPAAGATKPTPLTAGDAPLSVADANTGAVTETGAEKTTGRKISAAVQVPALEGVKANGGIVSDDVARHDIRAEEKAASDEKASVTSSAHDIAWYEEQEKKRRAAEASAHRVAKVEPAATSSAALPIQTSLPSPNVENGSADTFVRNIRFGEHQDKTRLVLDTNDQVAFSYDVDNKEQLLVIDLPQTGWRGSEAMDIANSPLVSSYSVVSDGKGGHQLVMQLKQPSQVLWAQALLPGGPQGHRIVIDLAPI